MATRRAVPVILAVAIFLFPAWQASASASVVTVATRAPVLQAQAQPEEDEGEIEESEETEEPEEGEGPIEAFPEEKPEGAPTPSPPVGAKEGAPVVREGAPVVSPRPVPSRVEGPEAPAGAPPGVPAPAPAVTPGRPQFVSLNFENADLELVLRSIADITGINFILAPGVKAPVTMRTTTKVPASDVFSIMEAILEVNNLVAVKDGAVYKIVPVAVAQQEPQQIQIGKEAAPEREREQYITQIVRLDHLSAEEMAKILQSFLGRGAKLVVHRETNSLVIGGFTSTVKRLLEAIKALDTPTKRDNVQRIFVYFVENAKAAELANVLSTLYGRAGALPRPPARGERPGLPLPGRPGAPPPPAPIPGQPPIPFGAAPPPGAALPPGAEAAPGEVTGDVTIVSDEATNALVIKTSPRNYEFIEVTIKALDIIPKQVLIELLIAEITLNDSFNLSVEELIRTGSFAFSGLFGGAGIAAINAFANPNTVTPPTGFTTTFVEANKFRVVLNALAAVTKVNILASPHLLTANNKEAKIQIGNEVPIISNEQASLTSVTAPPTGGAATPSGVFRSIQQKDIGILMGIKPHINEKRLVTLDIETENTNVDQTQFGATQSPSFLKRTTKTALVVQDGQSIVLGGSIQQTKRKVRSGVPFLSEIPLLGYLFRNTSDVLERTELLILITPHVIASPEEGRALTDQFRGRVESLEPILKSMPQLPPLKR